VLRDGRALVINLARGDRPEYRDPHRAHLYDPGADRWQAAPPLAGGLDLETRRAALLPDGRALVVGGSPADAAAAPGATAALLFDPASDTWQPAADVPQRTTSPVSGRSAAPLPDGRVLVAYEVEPLPGRPGARRTKAAAVYDPAHDRWAAVAPFPAGSPLEDERYRAMTLRDGRVLAVGSACRAATATQVYDPARDAWGPAAYLTTARWDYEAALTLLPDGRVLAIGGACSAHGSYSDPDGSAEVYDPAAATWSAAAPLSGGRYLPSVTLLPDGRVLVLGGRGQASAWDLKTWGDRFLGGQAVGRSLASGEWYDPR
jgi:hypothetical protein